MTVNGMQRFSAWFPKVGGQRKQQRATSLISSLNLDERDASEVVVHARGQLSRTHGNQPLGVLPSSSPDG